MQNLKQLGAYFQYDEYIMQKWPLTHIENMILHKRCIDQM